MKTLKHSRALIIRIAAGLLAVAPFANLRAQAPSGPDTTSSTSDDSTGRVTDISSKTITVDSRRGPFTYRLDYVVDVLAPDGHHLRTRQIEPGCIATVFYHFRDGSPTVDRIVIHGPSNGHDK